MTVLKQFEPNITIVLSKNFAFCLELGKVLIIVRFRAMYHDETSKRHSIKTAAWRKWSELKRKMTHVEITASKEPRSHRQRIGCHQKLITQRHGVPVSIRKQEGRYILDGITPNLPIKHYLLNSKELLTATNIYTFYNVGRYSDWFWRLQNDKVCYLERGHAFFLNTKASI